MASAWWWAALFLGGGAGGDVGVKHGGAVRAEYSFGEEPGEGVHHDRFADGDGAVIGVGGVVAGQAGLVRAPVVGGRARMVWCRTGAGGRWSSTGGSGACSGGRPGWWVFRLEGDARFEVCAVTADAAGAVDAAMRERPDLCLLDVRMPGGGLFAAWEISARLPRTKIVMLTVSGEDADLFAALRAGAEGYLLKTMSFARLPDALQGVRAGEAAIPPSLVARLLQRFRAREPRRRQPIEAPGAERLTSREWEVLELLIQGRGRCQDRQRPGNHHQRGARAHRRGRPEAECPRPGRRHRALP